MSDFARLQQAAEAGKDSLDRPANAWRCGKCGHHACEIGEARQSGSALASVFDLEGLRFTTVSCRRCGYTEFYKGDAGMLSTLFDFGVS